MNDLVEPTTVGLSEKTHILLKRLKEDGHFGDMVDAYRFGIALSLASGILPSDLPTPRTTVYSTATLDPDGSIAFAIRTLIENSDVSAYRWAERLAEWGINEISTMTEFGEIDFAALADRINSQN
jgi:hypothetical protein